MESGLDNNPLKHFVEFKYVKVDSNAVFYLHRKSKFLILFIAVSLSMYCGFEFDYMACFADNKQVDDKTFSTFCWARGTYIIKELLNRTHLTKPKGVPYPGVGGLSPEHTPLYQLAYPWMFAYLCMLFFTFQLSWFFWTMYLGGGNLEILIQELDNVIIEQDNLKKKKKIIVDFLMLNLHHNNCHAFMYIMCELSNFFHTCFYIWFTDFILQGEFSTYGFEVIDFLFQDQESRMDPMARSFPPVTTCIIKVIGPSGSLMIWEGLCVLPLNRFLEKTFVILWFWFSFLLIASVLGLVYRLLVIFIKPLRFRLLQLNSRRVNSDMILTICNHCDYGDWYYIFSIRNSLGNWVFDEILEDLGERLEGLEG